ncbi:MAG: acetyl-CoA carboxylase biotin carboxyl carrier protein [Subtercola sp.]|nr:acetyl-CoA carboxylase biotin carboxyl carrier protein [Subtercola sp.]
MPLDPPDIRELQAIVDWVNLTGDVRELSLTYGDVSLFVSRDRQAPDARGAVATAAAPAPAPVAAASAAAAPAAPAPAAPAPAAPAVVAASATPPASAETAGPGTLAADEVVISAPMVGTFYASPKPGSPPFVAEGDSVAVDTVLGIVEVMKLMSNIEAKVVGTVTRILVTDEQAVQYGEPLMVITRHD